MENNTTPTARVERITTPLSEVILGYVPDAKIERVLWSSKPIYTPGAEIQRPLSSSDPAVDDHSGSIDPALLQRALEQVASSPVLESTPVLNRAQRRAARR